MKLSSIVLAIVLAFVTVALMTLAVWPSDTIPRWLLGAWGGLATYCLGAGWTFVAITLAGRLRRKQ